MMFACPSAAALAVGRAFSCVSAMGRLVGGCPAPAATAILKIHSEWAPLLTTLEAFATLVTDGSQERNAATQVQSCLRCPANPVYCGMCCHRPVCVSQEAAPMHPGYYSEIATLDQLMEARKTNRLRLSASHTAHRR